MEGGVSVRTKTTSPMETVRTGTAGAEGRAGRETQSAAGEEAGSQVPWWR
jgi:hypothetical protein